MLWETKFANQRASTHGHGRPQGGGGTCPQPSWNLKKMTSYAALLWNTLTFSLAPSALAIKTLTCSLKCRKSAKKISFAASAHRKTVNLFRCRRFCPALENFLRAPMPMGVSKERGRGRIPPPMEFEKDDAISCPPAKYPNIFARAFGARDKNPYM